MKLQCVFVRFYKSFNFDQMRKSHPDALPKPWETIGTEFYPYIEIPIDGQITTIVGANESGKSHLLSAIRKAVSGEGFHQRDLCRYSPFFNVEKGQTAWPHLGLNWTDLSPDELEKLRAAVPQAPAKIGSFAMFREGPDRLRLFFPDRSAPQGHAEHVLEGDHARVFGADFLPSPFEIKPGIGLPNSVPLSWLRSQSPSTVAVSSRRGRGKLLEAGSAIFGALTGGSAAFIKDAQGLFPALETLKLEHGQLADDVVDPKALALARDLLVKLAMVEPDRLSDLADAIADGADGHANALITRINEQLAKHLNFPKWWVQDRDFAIRISPREIDIVFTVQDRTGTEYTFAERSNGLKYFLSYLIQARTRQPAPDRHEILLMDEPDAYLSAEAQQDLLKIFGAFADPGAGERPIQVVYVTHSPFLIDKNHAERIRVLQKGKGIEGTRVIRNASQNHYEPLRSAFGAFVGETAFIGSCNLLVEGAADQIIMAAAARIIRRMRSSGRHDSLDLNRIVIVPCGSASHVPYMVYLVRGRDAEKPPVVALLDSDVAGDGAARALRGGDAKLSRLIKPKHVVQIGEVSLGDGDALVATEIEDFLPTSLGLRIATEYFQEIAEFRDEQVIAFDPAAVEAARTGGLPLFKALTAAAEAQGSHIDKIGFARALSRVCEADDQADDVVIFLTRMRALFRHLNEKRRSAEREAALERIATLVDRQQRNFLRDHPQEATREEGLAFVELIEEILDDSRESDAIRRTLLRLRRDFALDDEPRRAIANYLLFRDQLNGLKHSFEREQALDATPAPETTPIKKAAVRPAVEAKPISRVKPKPRQKRPAES